MKFKCILAHPAHFCKCFFAQAHNFFEIAASILPARFGDGATEIFQFSVLQIARIGKVRKVKGFGLSQRMHDGDRLPEQQRFVQLVRDKKNRARQLLLQLQDLTLQFRAREKIQRRKRLVHE